MEESPDNVSAENGAPSVAAIREECERVLKVSTFARSPRLSEFLRFIVDEELAGRGARLNGTQIAIDVYQRDETFDPRIDPVVRVEARRLRRTLDQYYQGDGGRNAVRITMPKGSYRPVFEQGDPGGDPGAEEADGALLDRLKELPPVPEEATIAVLPFRALNKAAQQDHFADGFAGVLTTAITRFDLFDAISEQSTARYGNRNVDVRIAGRELGARFILYGSVRKGKEKLRVDVGLSDAEDGTELWAETFDRKLSAADFFGLEDELAQSVIALVADHNGIIPKTLRRSRAEGQAEKQSTVDAVLQFLDYASHLRLEDYAAARKAIEKALENEPGYSYLWSAMSVLLTTDYLRGITPERGPPQRAWELANHATTMAPNSPNAHLARGLAAFTLRRPDIVVEEAELAISLNPNNASNQGVAGHLIGFAGQLDRAIEVLAEVERLNPFSPTWMLSMRCLASYLDGDFEQSLAHAERVTLNHWPGKPFYMTIALGQLGRREEAASQLAELKRLEPDFARDPESYVSRYHILEEHAARVLDGLAKAGL